MSARDAPEDLSPAHVETHFGNPQTMELEPEHAKVSAYYIHFYTRGKVVTSRWPDPKHRGVNLGFPQMK